MSRTSLGLGPELYHYLCDVSVRENDILRRLRTETASLPMGNMQISPDQGAFMQILVELIDVRAYLEIGTFTGYSSLCVALAMPETGTITACDMSKEWTTVARRYWQEAGVTQKIDLRLAPATQSIAKLRQEGRDGTFDFAFIDADKKNYDAYYEGALNLVRDGGLIAIDNVLWGGRVLDPSIIDEDTAAIRALNLKIKSDERVTLAMLPVGDGLTLARKRQG